MPEPNTVVDIAGGRKTVVSKKKGRERSGKAGRGKRLIALGILILLVGGFLFFVFHDDLFGLRTEFFGFVHRLDPEYRTVDDRAAELRVFEAALADREDEAVAREAQLDAREAQIRQEQQELKDAEAQRKPVYRPPVNDDDVQYMQSIGKIYAAMEAENAAEIMVRLYSVEDMAAIVYYMKQSNAAAILEQMDAETAAEITDRLINE